MTIKCETRGTAGLCLLHTLPTGSASLMPLFAWNIVLVVPSGHTAQTAGSCSWLDRAQLWPRWGVRGEWSQPQTGKGNKAFPEKRCEGLPTVMEGCHKKQTWSEEGMMHEQLWLRWGYISDTRKSPPVPLLWPQTVLHSQLTPHWVKEPKEGCPKAPLLISWQSPSLGTAQGASTPGSLVALSAHLEWQPAAPSASQSHRGLGALFSWVSQDLHTWAVARQNTSLLWNLLSLCGLK